MTSWLRRQHPPAPPPEAEPEPLDSPPALRRSLSELVAFVNRSAGRLPVEAVVAARRITDVIAAVIDTAEDGRLDIHAGLSVKAMITDYLPTTLRTYLGLDESVVDVARDGGRTPHQLLVDQLDALWLGACDIRAAAQARDADALASHGNFLSAKFTGSDLDL